MTDVPLAHYLLSQQIQFSCHHLQIPGYDCLPSLPPVYPSMSNSIFPHPTCSARAPVSFPHNHCRRVPYEQQEFPELICKVPILLLMAYYCHVTNCKQLNVPHLFIK